MKKQADISVKAFIMKTYCFTALVFLSFSLNLAADSPLTSTHFYKAYSDLEIVQKAEAGNGILSGEFLDFLMETHSVDVKVAVINALGWDISGKNNARLLRSALSRKYGSYSSIMQDGKADELICLAYLQALDDYFHVANAVTISGKALAKAPNSYTVRIIAALIKAQQAMDTDWCQAYKLMDKVRQDTSLQQDMREEATAIIFNYMDSYAAYCE